MNIALFASAFHPRVGGVEELVRQLAHAYRRAGDTAIVLTNRWPRDLPSYEEYEGIPVYRIAMRVPESSLKARVTYQLTHRRIAGDMVEILKRHEIDRLHVQCVSSNGYYALLAKHQLKLPLIVTAQGERTMDAEQIYEHSTFMNATLRQLLAEADYITACSRDTLDDLEGYYGASLANRSEVIYNGIQLSDFENPQVFAHPRPYILGIGRLVPQKGFDVLLEAYAQSKVQTHDLVLAGEGSEREALEQLVQRLNLQGRVHLVGRADRPTAVSLFKGCSFFVLPSRHEPQGIVNLEAMAAGKAVVASRVGGVPEIVLDGQTGLLVPGEDVGALAGAIARLSEDTGLCEQLGAAGKDRAAGFDWSAIAARYREIYSKVGPASSEAGGVRAARGQRLTSASF